ncbi:MAG: sigma-54 dependent transcriptional regulator [Phycisphaerae bacterium]
MSQKAFILIVAEDRSRRERMQELLRERTGHAVLEVSSLGDALDSIRERAPDVVLAELHIAGAAVAPPLVECLDALAKDSTLALLGAIPDELSSHNIRITSIEDPDDADALVKRVGHIAAQAVARRDDRLLRSAEAKPIELFEGIVGQSKKMLDIIHKIKKVAPKKLTVLIIGETGTGKELIAEAIHRQSDRTNRAFKAVNCAGLNENLLESELFGHMKGAFTGAVADRKGYFVAADGGTLFLDEIGDMPLSMQAKLLRALERREITPVGSTDVRRVDVRIVAATNVNLRDLVAEKKFREDLFYRLHGWEIRVPPLRERREDIPVLAQHLLARANEKNNLMVPGFSADAMAYLMRHYWPGNVREMANVVEATAVNVESRRIEGDDLPEEIRGSRELAPMSGNLSGLTMEQIEKLMIERTLQLTGGNREQAAKQLGIGTRTLYRKIKEFGL